MKGDGKKMSLWCRLKGKSAVTGTVPQVCARTHTDIPDLLIKRSCVYQRGEYNQATVHEAELTELQKASAGEAR